MQKLKSAGVFVMFNVDDYVFQPKCKYLGGLDVTTKQMEIADCLVSSTSVLLAKMPGIKPRILRGPVLDYEVEAQLRQEYRRGSQFSIGWTIGRGRFGVMDDFVKDTLKILDGKMSDSEKCIFRSFGKRFFPPYKRVEVKEHLWFEPDNWKGLYDKLKEFDLGAIINPLDENDEFCQCKAELKFVESAAMGVPLIVSRIPPFLGFIKDGENGFFASTPEEYADKILLVMRDEPLSRKVSANAFKYVREVYDVMTVVRRFIVDINKAKEEYDMARVQCHFGKPNTLRKPF
jgi:hypothetical protein